MQYHSLQQGFERAVEFAGSFGGRSRQFLLTSREHAALWARRAHAWFRALPKPARVAGYAGFGVLAVWAVIISLFYAALLFGPINIDGLAPRIVASVEARLPDGMQMQVSGANLQRGRHGIGIRLNSVKVVDAVGTTVFSAPSATVGFKLLSVAAGDLSPERLIITEPVVSLTGQADNGGETMNVADIVAIAFLILNADGGLGELNVSQATVITAGEGPRLDGVDARFIAEPAGEGAPSIALEVSGGNDGGAEWAMNGRLQRRADGGLSGEFAFADLVPQELMGLAENSAVHMESPISGQLAFATLQDGTLADGRFDILVGAGKIQAGKDIDFLLDEARISGTWDASRRALRIAPSRILAGQNQAMLAGEFVVPDKRSMSYGTVPFGLGFTDVRIGIGKDKEPVAIDAVVFDAVYDVLNHQTRVNRLDFLKGDASLSMLGFVRQAPGSPGIALRGSAAKMSIDVFKSLWPEGLAPLTRDWIVRQVHGGDIVDATVNIDIRPGDLAAAGGVRGLPRGAVTVSFETVATEFGYFHDLPPIRDAKLRGTWTPTSFELSFAGDEARIDLPSGRTISVTGGSYNIYDTTVKPAHANLEIFSKGGLDTHLELLDFDPLNIARKHDLDIASMGGDAVVHMAMDFDIREGVRVEDTGLTVEATISRLHVPAGPGRVIEDGDVKLAIRNGVMHVAGDGRIGGVGAKISVTQSLYGNAEASERSVAMILDAEARKALGLDFGDLVQGTFPIDVEELGDQRRRVEADLKDVRLFQPGIGLDKPPGSPATFVAILSPDKETGGTRLSDMRISGRELFMSGSGLVRKSGGIDWLEFDSFRLQSDDSAKVTIQTDKNGNFSAKIEAARFDMRRVVENAKTGGIADGTAKSGDKHRYRVAAVIGSGRGYNGEILQSIDIDLDMHGDTVSKLKMTGAFADNSTMRMEIAPKQGNPSPVLSIQSNNAGRLLRWLDLYSRVNGGQIGMNARLGPGAGDATGRWQMVNFAINQDPSLSTLITQTGKMAEDPLWQAAAQRKAPSATNIGFDELYVDFSKSRGAFNLRNGVLRGPVVGATFDGQVDFTGRRINVNGTYVPLYAINNFFGRVPLLGTILGGRADEGLIGVNFSVRGNLNRPNLIVNPVSAVTPGIFRLLLDAPSRSVPGGRSAPRSNGNDVKTDPFDPLSQQNGR